jgi:heme exporter protein B
MLKEISVLIQKELRLEWRQKYALNGILLYVVSAVFIQEHQGRQLYYYMIASPEAIILSKIIYNTGLTLVLALLGYAVFSVILGNPVQDQGLFLLNLILGSIGFSASLTMVSGIASKAGNNATLMAILSFPVIIPILLMAIRISKNALDGLDWSVSADKLLALAAINAIVAVTGYILFPYLWRS